MKGANGSAIPGTDRYLGSFVIDKDTGKPKVYVLNEPRKDRPWKRYSNEFCPAAPRTKEFFAR